MRGIAWMFGLGERAAAFRQERQIEATNRLADEIAKAGLGAPRDRASAADAAFRGCSGTGDVLGHYSSYRFIRAWHGLCKGNFARVVDDHYDFSGNQVNLKRFCVAYQFNDWKVLWRWVTINGEEINLDSIQRQRVPRDKPNAAYLAMEKFLDKNDLL